MVNTSCYGRASTRNVSDIYSAHS